MQIDIASALKISLLVGLLATLMAIFPAIVIGWCLARREFPGKSLINVLVFFPMVSPPVATGYLLLQLFGRNGWLGQSLSLIGIQIPFSLLGAALASAVVGFPLLVMLIRSTFASLDSRLEDYALSSGHKPLEVFRRVVLPMSYPGILAGAVVCFARSIGEFGATVVLAGNIEGQTRTLSMAIYTLLDSPSGEEQASTILWISVLISLFSLVAYESLNRRFWKKVRS